MATIKAETCAHCRKNEAKWIFAPSGWSIYWTWHLNDAGDAVTNEDRKRVHDAVLLCEGCKRQAASARTKTQDGWKPIGKVLRKF